MPKKLYLCGGCYYNSDNDFFDPGFSSDGKVIEVCHFDLPLFPYARQCPKFELANRDPEALE